MHAFAKKLAGRSTVQHSTVNEKKERELLVHTDLSALFPIFKGLPHHPNLLT